MMQTEKISFEVSRKTAQAFRSASPEERQRIQAMIEISLMSREEAAEQLERIMDDMSRTARERGLTDDLLEEILNDK